MTTLSLLAIIGAPSARNATFGTRRPEPEPESRTPGGDLRAPSRAVLDRLRKRLERSVDEANPARVAPEPAAAAAATMLGLPWVVDHQLREPDFGRWCGRSLEDVAASDPAGLAAWTRDASAAPHGGESLADLVARLRRDVLRPGRRFAIASPLVVRGLIAGVLEPDGQNPPGNAILRVDVELWSVTTLTSHHGRWKLRLTA
jgi:broad specificity phosphatase PhoE